MISPVPLTRRPEPEYMDDPTEALAYARADFAEVNQAFAERLLELASAKEQAEAVDLGTGPADIPIRVLRLRPTWRIVAVDAAQAMLALAQEAVRQSALEGKVTLVLADAKATPFPERRFPVAFSNSLLHHVSHAATLWNEIKRIVSPGGLFFMRDLLRPKSEREAAELVALHAGEESELLKEEFYRSLLSAYTVEEIRLQLQEAGLSCLSVRQVTDRHVDIFGTIP